MLKKANINWTAKQLVKMTEKGTLNFNNSVQRGLVWDIERKSLLIHSMIEGFPIPAFFAAKNDNGYDMLDGKQRSDTIRGFINNEYKLTDIPEISCEGEETTDINGSMFTELSEELQDRIKDYSLTIYYFDGITEDEISEMFFRLNNGKPLTAIELTRVKAKSIEKIKEIGKHELFNSALTVKAINKYTNEDIVIKSWALLNCDNPSFETKYIRPLIESAEITEQQEQDIKTVYSRILEVYTDIKAVEDKESNKIAKRIITRTHLLSIVPVALLSIQNNINKDSFAEFVHYFFNGKKSASINDIYNIASGSHSASADNVKKRIDTIMRAYKDYFKKDSIKDNKINNDPKIEVKKEIKKESKGGTISIFEDWEQPQVMPHEAIKSFSGMY
jgi:hypothetical protein